MPTVLLAEDADDLAGVVARELRANGYAVLRAADGRTALELHERERPDLLILDWMLPELDGLSVLRELRRTAATPVLMLTARAEEVDRVLGLELGADDYLSKPFSVRELMARVRALLRREERLRTAIAADRGSGDERPIDVGPLHLDPVRHEVAVAGRPVELSRHEFELLALLMRHPGRAFSRTYLLDVVWDVEAVAGDRSVDNSVLRLRRKLGAAGGLIETVWGVGYRLRAAPAGQA